MVASVDRDITLRIFIDVGGFKAEGVRVRTAPDAEKYFVGGNLFFTLRRFNGDLEPFAVSLKALGLR